jgi:hypothetical protein
MAIKSKHYNGRLEFHVEEISWWDGLEEICRFFVEQLGAELLSKCDGPDARAWSVRMNNETIVVVHDDMDGNFFFAERKEGEPVANEMANKLAERIQEVNG